MLDTLGIEEGALRVMAVSDTDTTRRVVDEVQSQGGFTLELAPGPWTLRAFRDRDKNRVWTRDEEPASDPLAIRVEPADDVREVVLVLRRPRGVR